MAERINMAEGIGPGPEGIPAGSPKGISNISARDRLGYVSALPPGEQAGAMKVFGLEIGGGSGTDPEWLTDAAKQPSRFQEVSRLVGLLSKVDPSKLTSEQQVDFNTLLTENTQAMQEFDEFIRTAPTSSVLAFVRDDIRRIYTAATQSVPRADPDSWSGSPQPKSIEDQLGAVNKALANYQERFWDYGEATLRRIFGENADIKALRQKYEGAASYLASRVATAIGKELKNLPLEPGELGDFYLADVKKELEESKGERERIRREKRKRATADERLHYTPWREKFDFTWAETPEELDDSVEDWLDYFQQALPREAEEAVYGEVQKGMVNVLASLEQARNHIGLEANDARIQALREKIVGHVTTIAGARLLESRGGFEYYIKLKTDFAANYNPYYDGIYLKPGSAIMADQLSENEGEIYRGGSLYAEKPLAGDTKTFRSELERKAIRHGIDHELYITEADFKRAVAATDADEERIQNEVALLNLSPEEARAEIQKRIDETDRRYGWDDEIEQLLLTGGDRDKAMAAHDIQALMRMDIRSLVFQETKKSLDLDKEDMYEDTPGHFVSLASLSPDQRKQAIRQRIEAKMTEEGNLVLLDEIRRLPDQASRDRALWKWVKDYNKPRIELRREGSSDEPWFPSLWDAERLSISRPEDLIDRALSKDQFQAMVEKVDDPYKGLTDEQVQRQIRTEFRQQVQAEVVAKGLSPEESAKEFKRLMQGREKVVKGKIKDVLFKRQQREARAIRNYNLNIAQDKFLELQARWGGLTTRVFTEKGMEMRTIFSLAEEILKAKIDKEADDIEKKVDVWKTGYVAANPNLTADAMKAATIQQTRLFRRNATFAATLGLREIGIAKDLPIWNYFYYGDSSQIGVFAPLVGYTHDDKGILPELLDRSRREMEAVFSFLATKYLDEKMLVVVDYPGLVKEDEEGVQEPAHDEKPVRPRVINEGGVFKLRDLFEARMMISTSGGVKVADLISRIADLGIYDELWENGCKDKREWQGFRKRRNRWELRQQSFLNTREWADPITHVQRLAGAAVVRRALVGGEIPGQGKIPGGLNEPYDGLWQYRVEYLQEGSFKASGPTNIGRQQGPNWEKELQEVLEKEENLKLLNQKEKDNLVKIGGGILKNLRLLMDLRDYVRNRANHAPKNSQYDNELMLRAFVKEAAKRQPVIAKRGDLLSNGQIAKKGGELLSEVGGEVLGTDHLGYAIQGRSALSNAIFTAILRSSTYHIFDEADRRALDGRAKVVKERMEAKRKELMEQILPLVAQPAIDGKKNELGEKNQLIKDILQRFEKAKSEGKDTPEEKERSGEQFSQAHKERRVLEAEIAKLTNQAVEAKLDSQFNAGDFTHQTLRTTIARRRQDLAKLHPDPALGNIELEINRLINYYIDVQLHKQFVGEWPARLAT